MAGKTFEEIFHGFQVANEHTIFVSEVKEAFRHAIAEAFKATEATFEIDVNPNEGARWTKGYYDGERGHQRAVAAAQKAFLEAA